MILNGLRDVYAHLIRRRGKCVRSAARRGERQVRWTDRVIVRWYAGAVKRKPNRCAYCGEARLLTREHIWPKCFLERRPGWAAFTLAAWKVHGGDQTVRDVCQPCNNDILTPLDAYFCKLDEEFFVHTHGFNSEVEFVYDYDLLTRSLLKIAYNTARANGSATEELRNTALYILGRAGRPSKVAVVAELVKPAYVERSPSGLTIPPKEVRPLAFRSARTRLETDYARGITTRLVAVNSFFFHLLLGQEALEVPEFARTVERFSTDVRGCVAVDPSVNRIVLRSSEQDGVTSHLPQFAAFRDQYRHFFDKQKSSPRPSKPA
jgi:hypothetical protein